MRPVLFSKKFKSNFVRARDLKNPNGLYRKNLAVTESSRRSPRLSHLGITNSRQLLTNNHHHDDGSDNSSSDDGDNSGDYVQEGDDSSHEHERHGDDSSSSEGSSEDDGSEDDDSVTTRKVRKVLTVDEMYNSKKTQLEIGAQIAYLRDNILPTKRLDDNGKPIKTRKRIMKCSIKAQARLMSLLIAEGDKRFRRVSTANSQAKDAFMNQCGQFLTFASQHCHIADSDDLVAIIGHVVTPASDMSIVRRYADWLEEEEGMAHDTVRGRLIRILVLLKEFVDCGKDFCVHIPTVNVFLKGRVSYHSQKIREGKLVAETLIEAGLLCSKADLYVMEERLAPILANIFKLAAIDREKVNGKLYNMALAIIFFQFYSSNLNGRFRAIVTLSAKEGRQLSSKLYGVSSKTKNVRSLGLQMISITPELSDNLDQYDAVLRPTPCPKVDSFFLTRAGKCWPDNDGSKVVARMTEHLFGLYLTVTTLRGITSTEMKVAASDNALNPEQCDVVRKHCQGHGSQTANSLYTHMTQQTTASMLARVNTTMNSASGNSLMFPPSARQQAPFTVTPTRPAQEEAPTCTDAPFSPLYPVRVAMEKEVATMSGCAPPPGVVEYSPPMQVPTPTTTVVVNRPPRREVGAVANDDFGQDHPDFNSSRSNITWTAAEVRYIIDFKATCVHRDVFSRCLKSIMFSPDATIRRMFHTKHIRDSSVLRDGVKNKHLV